jgi:hypothetical protein
MFILFCVHLIEHISRILTRISSPYDRNYIQATTIRGMGRRLSTPSKFGWTLERILVAPLAYDLTVVGSIELVVNSCSLCEHAIFQF